MPMETTDTSIITVVIVVLLSNFLARIILLPELEGSARIAERVPHEVVFLHG